VGGCIVYDELLGFLDLFKGHHPLVVGPPTALLFLGDQTVLLVMFDKSRETILADAVVREPYEIIELKSSFIDLRM
jgi:hypothetical protein